MPISLVPFSGGLNTHIDTRLLPDGALADAVNVEMDRQGRLVGRAGYTAQAATVYDSGTLVAYDLFQMNDRLFALGDAQSFGFASDVFELCPSGVAAAWRPTSTENELHPRLPRATGVRDMCRPPDQAEGISNMACAATAGYACLAWNITESSILTFVHVVSAAKNQPLVFQKLEGSTEPLAKVRVVGLSDRFIIIGLDATTRDIRCSQFIPASSETVAALATGLMVSGGDITTYAVCKVAGSDEFMIVANLGGTVTTRRYSNAGVLQVPSGGQYSTQSVVPTALAIEASSSANQVNIAMVVSGEARVFSYNLSTGAQIGAGPHVPFTGETSVEISLCRISSSVIQVVSSVTSETAPTIFTRGYTVSTNTFATLRRAVTDAQLTTSAVFSTETVFGMRYGLGTVGNTPNMIVSSGSGTDHVTPLVVKDLEVCETTSALLPDLAFDSSTSKYYWCNAVANPDGSSVAQLTEFSLTSTARRQTAQLGNLVYIAGGAPLVFDGLNLSESGFQERPRIISLTASNSTGQLLSGGTYKYRCHWEWIDSDGNLHLSPPSTISEVELGNTDDTVTAVVTTPHSMRRNVGNPTGTVACVLSRTLATVTRTAPSFTGAFNVDPPISSLTGLDLNLYITDDTGSTMFTITFDAASISAAAIVIDINTVTTGRITASNVGGAIKLTADDSGEGIFLTVAGVSGDAAEILGLTNQVTVEGTTTYTVGENFQRASVAYTSTSSAVAAYRSVIDTCKDQSDPIVDTDLIRQQVLYSQGVASGAHHAPPPGEYIWAGRERVLVAGQPKRSKWTVSKTLVPAEPAEFAFDGFLGYSNTVTGDIEACAVMGDALIFWTRHQIWQVVGSGPNRAGQGEFFAPQCISRAGGLVAGGWRSLCETDEGIWFQRAADQLCLLTKGGMVEWRGQEVQDKLVLYPVVVAACYVSTKHSVAFAVQSTDGLTGGILRYDLDAKIWFFDDVGVVATLATYLGRLAYIQSGIVYIQDASPGSGTFVGYSLTTGMFQGFQVLGYGQLNEIGILGTFRGDCTVTISLSVNGTSFSTLDTFSLTTAEYAVGQRVRLMKAPATMQYDSFAVKVAITGTTNSEGLWLHALALDTELQPDLVRLGATHTK
jgi:hypothetical protein